MSEGGEPRRLVIFGVTGQVGQELVDRLDESEWPIAELVGVASPDSAESGETRWKLSLDTYEARPTQISTNETNSD